MTFPDHTRNIVRTRDSRVTTQASALGLLGLLAGLALAMPMVGQIQAVQFQVALSGVIAPATSVVLTNIGQSAHLVRVEFPSAVGAVAAIQVRLEASYDGTNFFPIMADITDAPLLTGGVYAFGRCFGPFPALRIRSLVAVPSAMTVRYTGHMLPTQPAIALLADRFAF